MSPGIQSTGTTYHLGLVYFGQLGPLDGFGGMRKVTGCGIGGFTAMTDITAIHGICCYTATRGKRQMPQLAIKSHNKEVEIRLF